MAYQQDFTRVEGVEPHRVRTREILKAHPEVKKLITKNPMTAVWILAKKAIAKARCVNAAIGGGYQTINVIHKLTPLGSTNSGIRQPWRVRRPVGT